MTKGALIELVLRRLEGGDYADSQYTEDEIAYYIETAINKLFKAQEIGLRNQSIHIPDSTTLMRFETQLFQMQELNELSESHDTSFFEMNLPCAPISSSNGIGLFKVYPKARSKGGAMREFIPLTNGNMFMLQSSVVSTEFLDSIDYYEWESGTKVYLRPNPTSTALATSDTMVVLMIVGKFTDLGVSSQVPFPAEMANDVVLATVQLLTGVREDDSSTNFNGKPDQ